MSELPPPLPPGQAVLLPTQHGRLPLKLRRSLAALSLVGAALVALPVAQLLRYQAAEEQSLRSARARLDPISRAVHLQRGLLAHRDLAAQVLGGRPALEAERLQRQLEVDSRVSALLAALAGGQWDVALEEAAALLQDWRALVQQLLQRRIDVAGSAAAHRLLVEQTLQVIDLVSAEALANPQTGSAASGTTAPAAALAALQGLPRLIWQTSLLAQPADPTAASVEDVAERLGRTLTRLDGRAQARSRTPQAASSASSAGSLPAMQAFASQPPAADAALRQAVALAGSAGERYFALLRSREGPGERQNARQAAVQAQFQLYDLVEARLMAQLDGLGRDLLQRRALLLGSLVVLALLAAGLLLRLWLGLLQWQSDEAAQAMAHAEDPDVGPGTGDAPFRLSQSDDLMLRMRLAPAAPSTKPVKPEA